MPTPPPIPLTRRAVLAGAAVVAFAVAGCSTGAPKEPEPARRDPLADLLDEHVAIAGDYAAAIAAAPGDTRLPPLAGNVDAQIAALSGALAVRVPTSTAASSTTSSPSAQPTTPAADPVALVTALRDSESALAQHSAQLALTEKADRAPLLASIDAAHQGAAQVLG